MAVDDEWILYLEKNPQFYEITKGDFFMRFIEKISKGVKKLTDLKPLFFEIDEEDFETIMDALVSLHVVTKTEAGGMVIFNLTPKGKELLSTWKKTHRFFST